MQARVGELLEDAQGYELAVVPGLREQVVRGYQPDIVKISRSNRCPPPR